MRKHVREVEVAAVCVVVLRACVCVGYMQYDIYIYMRGMAVQTVHPPKMSKISKS